MSTLGIILIVVLLLFLFGAVPRQGSYNADWGYAPGGIVGLVLVIVLILFLLGRL